MLIVILGGGMRLWQINFGLPRVLFTDEEFFTTPALRIADGGWNPGWFGAPASPQIYTVGLVWRVQNAYINQVADQHLTPTQRFTDDPTLLITSGRVLSALMGTYAIILVFLFGISISSRVGLIAAVLVAGNFFLIDHSHVIRPDIWQTTFILEALLALWKILQHPTRRKNFLVFGVATGLAISQKFTSLLLAPFVFGVIIFLRKKQIVSWSVMIRTALLVVATVIITMPFLALNSHQVVNDLRFELTQDHGVHSHLGIFGNFTLYLESFGWQLGTLLGILSLGAFIWQLRTKKTITAGTFLFLAVMSYILGLLFSQHAWDRWLIPVITLVSVPMAQGIAWLLQQRYRRLILIVLVVAFLAPVMRLTRTLLSYTKPPTVELIRTWILDNAPMNSTVVTDPYGPKNLTEYSVEKVSSIGVRAVGEYQRLLTGNQVYIVANGDIQENLLELARRKGPSTSFAVVGGRYADFQQAFPTVFTTSATKTAERVVMVNDFMALNMWTVEMYRGPVMWVMQVK